MTVSPIEEWILRRKEHWAPAGMLAGVDATTADVTRAVEHRLTTRGDAVAELELLRHDPTRVYVTGTERVVEADAFYEGLLGSIATLAGVAGSIGGAKETWTRPEWSDDPIIHVSFDGGGVERHVWLPRRGDFAEPRFIVAVDSGLTERGLVAIDHSSDWWIFHIAEEQREILETSLVGTACASDDHNFHLVEAGGSELPVLPVAAIETYGESEAVLVFARGVFRHGQGDADGAWADWTLAGELGMDDARHIAARTSES